MLHCKDTAPASCSFHVPRIPDLFQWRLPQVSYGGYGATSYGSTYGARSPGIAELAFFDLTNAACVFSDLSISRCEFIGREGLWIWLAPKVWGSDDLRLGAGRHREPDPAVSFIPSKFKP